MLDVGLATSLHELLGGDIGNSVGGGGGRFVLTLGRDGDDLMGLRRKFFCTDFLSFSSISRSFDISSECASEDEVVASESEGAWPLRLRENAIGEDEEDESGDESWRGESGRSTTGESN